MQWKRGLSAFRCYSLMLVDTQELVDSWGKCDFFIFHKWQPVDFDQQTACGAPFTSQNTQQIGASYEQKIIMQVLKLAILIPKLWKTFHFGRTFQLEFPLLFQKGVITSSTTIMKQTSVSGWSHNLNFEGEASFTRLNSSHKVDSSGLYCLTLWHVVCLLNTSY